MIWIGNHVSVAKGYAAMADKEQELGGSTFAFFTRNPRSGREKAPAPGEMELLREKLSAGHFGPLVAHGSYTMNVCSAKEEVREFSRRMLKEDLAFMEELPGSFYNFHPGSHTGQGAETGIRLIADALNSALTVGMKTTVLLETMAGKGSEVGRTFEELRKIIDQVEMKDKLGVCLDTCHVWDGGYDLVNDLDGVLAEFDRVIGLDRLRAVHFNDSKNALGARKDRHEKLGQGKIGLAAMHRIAVHPLLQGKPFILETPNEDDGYAREIALVRSWFSMRFIVGGRAQGKTAFARKLLREELGDADFPVADGRSDPPEKAFAAPLVIHLESYVGRILREGGDPLTFAAALIEKNPGAVVTADEIGCGVVPEEAEERRYRDVDGAVCQKIAAFSREVWRVLCGIPVKIKGAEENL
jgi:deoxyribonuclease-4